MTGPRWKPSCSSVRSEPDRGVDACRDVLRVGHDDQRGGAELGLAVAGRPGGQRAGQALAAGRRVGDHVLVAGQPAARPEQAELGHQPPAGQRAQPGAVPGFGQPAVRGGPAPDEAGDARRVVRLDRGQPQVQDLLPVVVGGQRPQRGRAAGPGRLVHLARGGGEHQVALVLQARGHERGRISVLAADRVQPDRHVLSFRELSGERGQPVACRVRLRRLGQQQEVAPPEVRQGRVPHHQVAAPVGLRPALQRPQGQVSPVAKRGDAHPGSIRPGSLPGPGGPC